MAKSSLALCHEKRYNTLMLAQAIESSYPENFRKEDVMPLRQYLSHRQSIELVGMKRVGISNFLRFYLTHQFSTSEDFFVYIDLNDLIERDMFPFWRLVFKRILDTTENTTLPVLVIQRISKLFDRAIQSGDVFITYDSIRESLAILTEEGKHPTLFLSRFDRLKDVVTPEFFDNLQGLHYATNEKLSYVFTSYRGLDLLAPEVFPRTFLATFSKKMYLCPANHEDSAIVFDSFAHRYGLTLEEDTKQEIIRLCGGHVHYLLLCLIIVRELGEIPTFDAIQQAILHDERIALQSEEIWDGLEEHEKRILKKLTKQERISPEEKTSALHLWNAGFILDEQSQTIFSPLFANFIAHRIEIEGEQNSQELTKKEFMLFSLLKEHTGEIVDREVLVTKVWPEYSEFGISDWAVDRLVSRLRGKLRKQNEPAQIITVRTRGYKLQA